MQILLIILVVILLIFGITAITGAPYVPSKKKDLEKAFSELYKMTSKDTLVDLGVGDGCVSKIANSFGAKTFGIEINPILFIIAKIRLNGKKNKVVLGSYYHVDFPKDTTVVYTFGDSRDIKKMYQLVQKQATKLGKTLYFISYVFAVPNQKPVKKVKMHYLYKVEAKND